MTHFGSQKFSPTSRDMTALQNRLLATTISKSSMKMEILNEAPPSSTFIPLAEHQSATPVSFYTGPPVLHYHSNRCKVLVLERDIETSPALAALTRGTSTASTNDNHVNGHSADEETESIGAQKIVDDVDVWVTSDKLFLFSTAQSTGLAIPYPSISLHAIQSLPVPSAGEQQGLYMQLMSLTPAEEEEEPDSISLTIIPPPSNRTQPDSSDAIPPLSDPTQPFTTTTDTDTPPTPASALFAALSTCSNLHPDPIDPGDEDDNNNEPDIHSSTLFHAGMITPGDTAGGLPPPMPGSGGWITAENMDQYFDEEGNWIGGDDDEDEKNKGEPLGPGAGTVRTREEGDEDTTDETKWQRTS